MTLARRCAMSLAVASLLLARPATAQITVVPEFEAAGPADHVGNVDVAVGTDGTILVGWTAFTGSTHVATRRFDATGMPLSASQSVADPAVRYLRDMAADPHGGYVVATDDVGITPGGLFRRPLDALGLPVGSVLQVADPMFGSVISPSVAALTDGAAFVWLQNGGFFGRRYDAGGASSGPFLIQTVSGSLLNVATAAAGLPDGGFVLAWSYFASGLTARLRVYNADGTSRSPIVDVGAGTTILTGVAANPAGGFTAVGLHFPATFGDATEVVAYRFTDNATPLGTTTLDTLAPDVVGIADIAYDAAGNAWIPWTEYRFTGPNQYFVRNRGRGIAADGTPYAHPITIAQQSYDRIHTAAFPDGRFVNVWAGVISAQANVVALCTPAVAQCGDGVVVAECEQCDDGAGNSDTTPDACRSDCIAPRCGDGVTDPAHGEQCDDGNDTPCDGCDPQCRLEFGLSCGDGFTLIGCGEEQCDDGNAVTGDGCGPDCTLEVATGAGSRATDCLAGWSVDNPANVPLLDSRGAFGATQVCTDDDPRCDFDGGVPGTCTFRVRACADTTHVAGCNPPARLRSWQLVQPSAAKAATHPDLAAIRAALATAPGAIVGPDQQNVCAEWVELAVPLRGSAEQSPGKLVLKSSAQDYDARRDVDKLKLVCLPSAP